MSELSQFFAQCVASGALLTSLCALVVIPVLAWLAVRGITPAVVRMRDDPGWQAPLAAGAASLPGILFLLVAASALGMRLEAACLTLPAGRVISGLVGAAALAAVARATYYAMRRARGVRWLIAASSAPEARLNELAAAAHLRARQIYDNVPICVLAGIMRPLLLVSTGALERLNDEELRAAFLHEAAHARRGDQLIAAVISFFVDLLPLRAAELVETYRGAREVAADQRAIRAISAHHLAAALIAFARGAHAVAATIGLTGSGEIRSRVLALLGEKRVAPPNWLRRFAVALFLLAIFAAGVAAPSLAAPPHTPCAQIQAHIETST